MDDTNTKAWYESKTVWGGLMAILGACGSLPRDLARDAKRFCALQVEALAATATAAGGLLAIIGRMSASRRLR